jgi:hypothetical protein
MVFNLFKSEYLNTKNEVIQLCEIGSSSKELDRKTVQIHFSDTVQHFDEEIKNMPSNIETDVEYQE